MVDRSSKESLSVLLRCALSTTNDWHICEEPVQLSCCHYVCKSCLSWQQRGDQEKIECNTCQQNSECDANQSVGYDMFQAVLDDNLSQVFNVLYEDFENKFKQWKDIDLKNEEILDRKIESIKEQIEIKIESIKNELDKLSEELHRKLDMIKNEWMNLSTNGDYERIDVSNMKEEIENLKYDISKQQYITKQNLYMYQNKLKELNELLTQYQHNTPNIEIHLNTVPLETSCIGEITYSFGCEYDNQEIMERAKENNLEKMSIENNENPCLLCVLPNGKLLSCCYNRQKLFLHDSNFKLLKTIEYINGKRYKVLYVDTNKRNAIYFSACLENKIIKTDLDFNQLAEFSDSWTYQVNHPNGICFSDGKVYVCNGLTILKCNEDLVFDSSYNLDYKPWYIKVIKNFACITQIVGSTIHFHNTKNFNEIRRYERHYGVIGASNSYFYEYNNENRILYCYNINGEISEQISLDFNIGIGTSNGNLCLYNSHLIICDVVSGVTKI